MNAQAKIAKGAKIAKSLGPQNKQASHRRAQ